MISIFAKHTYTLDDPNQPGQVALQRVSSRIRGEEIAGYLGAKFNPTEGYENDVCIYVKNCRTGQIKDGDYADVLDDLHTSQKLADRPKVNLIAMSRPHKEYLRSFLKNPIFYIPHHHINFDRLRRKRKRVLNCGYIGSNTGYDLRINREVGERLKKIGLNFKPLLNFTTRKEVIRYYRWMDLQVIGYFDHLDVPYYHQTKIVNAMSFGIPTIAGPRLGYRDVKDFFISVNNLDELVEAAQAMKNPTEYNKWPDKIIAEAEKYHISQIAKLYRKLK